MNPAVARKLIEKFDAALSVQLFADTELIRTGDELDHVPTEKLFEMYRAWPPRVRMSEAKFIEFLKITCRLDVTEYDPDEPTLIVGVQLRTTATALVRAKRRNASKPPPDRDALQRAARLPTLSAAARYLHISTGRLERLCKADRTVAALFSR